jgi:photosystem II stability/assembly factor-like uncharacterized protein
MRQKASLSLSMLCLVFVAAACSATPTANDTPTAAPLNTAAPANISTPTEAEAPTQAVPTATSLPTPVPPTAAAAATLPPATVEPQAIASATAPVALPSGKSIARLSAGQPVTITALHMLDANTGWAVAQVSTDLDSHILQTADGAKTWRDVTPPESATSVSDPNQPVGKSAAAFFLNPQEAWVAFGYPPGAPLPNDAIITWATRDGGKTWSPSAPLKTDTLEQYWPSDMVFAGNQAGWLLVHAGAGMSHDYVALYATQDSGASWTEVVDPMALPDNGSLSMSCQKSGLAFADAQNGWVAGDCFGVVPGSPYLYQTADGGHTWQFYQLQPPAEAPDLFTNENNACGAGVPVFVSPTDGKLPVSCQALGTGQSRGWLYATADGGKTWTSRPLPAPYGVLQFLNVNVGWWVGGSAPFDPTIVRQLYATQDGGQTWVAVKKLNWGGQVDFIDAKSGWAVAKSDQAVALVNTQDGGQKWNLSTPQVAP